MKVVRMKKFRKEPPSVREEKEAEARALERYYKRIMGKRVQYEEYSYGELVEKLLREYKKSDIEKMHKRLPKEYKVNWSEGGVTLWSPKESMAMDIAIFIVDKANVSYVPKSVAEKIIMKLLER